MKKLIIIAIMAVGLFRITEVQAQYVEKIDTSIFIDVQDMPVGSWSTTSLNSVHAENSSTNTLYKRFEVAKSDESATMYWDAAKAVCANKGTGWRLPTQKELQLIWVMKDLLQTVGVAPFSGIFYWSSTAVSGLDLYAWYVRINFGFTDTILKNSTLSTRCIREVY